MKTKKAVRALREHFKTQQDMASQLGISQQTVSDWLCGKSRVRALKALRAEKLTGGEIKAVWLCPELAEVDG